MKTPSNRTEKLDLRLTPAAKLVFSPLRRHLGLNAEKWEAFMDALDAPPRSLPQVEQLFSQASVFEIAPSK